MADALYRELRVLDMTGDSDGRRQHCCDRMRAAISHHCKQHADPYDCPDALVVYRPVFDEYGLVIHDGGASYLLIAHCPFCGARLPESKRDLYFDRLESLGITVAGDEAMPAEFKSDAWWQADGSPS